MVSTVAIHFINLDRDTDRRIHMESTLDGMGLDYERFAAVNASHLTPEQEAYYQTPQRAHLGAAEIAAFLSHITVWKKIAAGDAAFGLVFEDDVIFAENFADFLRGAVQAIDPNALQIHRFETFLARVTLRRQVQHQVGVRRAYVLESNHGGTAAYLLNKKTAAHLIEISDRFSNAVDIDLFDPQRRTATDVQVLQWLPAPCVQDMQNGYTLGFTSNVLGDRADERDGVLFKEGRLTEQVKAALRPAYTALYSAVLFPSGRWRTPVPFG